MCLANSKASIAECMQPTTYDLDEIWRWNKTLPPSYNFCMHDMIAERSQRAPNKVAICSWDGELTYAEVDQYSTRVASTLQQEMGVQFHDIIPVCFEKSRWTIVAVLAVMKAGATFAMMDPTLPLARLQNMATQVGAKTMVTSRLQHDLSMEIMPSGNRIVVESDTFHALPQVVSELPAISPSTLMYIIFTSGSTGTPKGVTVSHRTYTSSAIPRAQAVGYSETFRVLDFASYAFDVSIDSMLLTLGNGGCLCIPSDEDRLNDINEVIRKLQVNYAGITPSVARILESDVIASLSGGLGLGGEAASARDVTLWGQDARIIIGYGPCECTIGCTVNSSAATGRDYISIGPGNGAAIWVVNPNDHNSLVPVGAVGELLVEGPIVGQGYLNDPDKTAESFIENPPWLVAGHKSHVGRRGRLYKTGDLGKYDPDGCGGIIFAGRKDTQVKLRGQRIELGEIESQLRDRLPSNTTVIVEVIKAHGQPTLVAFVAAQSGQTNDFQSVDLPDELRMTLSTADADLAKVLPRYMVPTAYIPINHIPVLISGKTDRKRLREFGATVDLRQLDQNTSTNRELTEVEQRLREAWAQTLKLDPATIRLEDNFFALGGDSLWAMRLVPVCRTHGLDLSVTSIFGHPTLSAMAGIVQICDVQVQVETPPFSMISTDADSACLVVSQMCGIDPAAVEDIYPCTPTQESLFTFSIKSTKAYIAQRVASIPTHTNLDDLKRAWEQVVTTSPILRTRLAQLQEPGLQQVVLKTNISWRHSTDLEQYLKDDREEKMQLGEDLARYAIVDHPNEEKRYMVWTVHHVLYDGWSEPLILKQVSDALQDEGIDTRIQAQIRNFVKYVRETDEIATQEYWRRELNGAVGPQFPRLPFRDFLPNPDAMVERQIPLETSAKWPFTMATLIRGAWALLASRYSGSNDVVFGETLTGRDIPLAGVGDIVGPLIATVPVRIQVPRLASIESYLQTVQQGLLARTPYQHMGMQNIRKVSEDAQHACEAPTGLVIQPEPEYIGDELGFKHGDAVREALHFNPYPLMLACGIRKSGFRICASFDSGLIEVAQMERVLAQFEMVCLELTKGLSWRLDELSCLPEAELEQIWRWNQTPPLSLDESTGTLRADAGTQPRSTYPPVVVPWVCDPRNPSLLSPIGCAGELWLEGCFLQGEVIESPTWLVAGSSICSGRAGKVQRTGDLVQLRDDGSLVFIGREENIVRLQGHAVNIADIESQFERYLPPTVHAAVAVIQESSELIVLIEQQSSQEEYVQLVSTKHESFAPICPAISISLATALKRFDKFIRDSLPSYMAPSAYVPVEKMRTEKGQIDRGLLNQLTSGIPRPLLNELKQGLNMAWSQGSTQTNLTASETILQSAWAKILRVRPEEIDVDDNFFRRGGDSVLAMKLVSSLRAEGHTLTVADIFQHMRLGDAAKRLKVGGASVQVQPYKAFSTLGDLDVEQFITETIRPNLAGQGWSVRDVYPVTDSQALDIRATVQAPRTSFQYTMLYFDQNIDQGRLTRACTQLIKTHDILRTVFIEHESIFFQVVLDDLESVVTTQQATGNLQQYVSDLCNENIESPFPLGSPFLKVFHVQGNDNQSCLVIGLSHAQYDGMSLPRLLRDLETLYTGKDVTEFAPFSSYMSRIYDSRIQAEAIKYWRNIMVGSSLSVLSGQPTQISDTSIFHTNPVSISQAPADITTATLLTSAWALVLARRLQTADVTFGGVTMGRHIDLTNVENVMGPCYQLTPIRVVFNADWTPRDLLRFVQRQSAESAAYDFLGFEVIRKHCSEWPSEAKFLDSIVHHQDWEDFDAMDFAGGSCRVDVRNPHGDAAWPMKVVSFVKGGQLHVGIVGSEVEFVDGVLGELVEAVEELAGSEELLKV